MEQDKEKSLKIRGETLDSRELEKGEICIVDEAENWRLAKPSIDLSTHVNKD